MDETRVAIFGVTGLIVLVTLVSGPLVGAVDLTHEPAACQAPPGTGSATVTVEDLPDRATLSKGEFDAGPYYLEVPAGSVSVTNVTGQPLLSYDLRIHDLNTTVGPTIFLCVGQAERQPLSIHRATIDTERVDADSYDATLSLALRGDGNETILAEKSIVVEVER